jgi:hypothetical protein
MPRVRQRAVMFRATNRRRGGFPADSTRNLPDFCGMDRALGSGVVNSVQRTASAFLVLTAIIGSAAVPAFSGLMHPLCAAREHDCGATPKIETCCCGDSQSSPSEGMPVQSRVVVAAPLSTMPAMSNALQLVTPHAFHNGYTPPPLRFSVDLPTLFSSLLI